LQPNHFFYKNISAGEISQTDIIANKTITYIDELATEELKLTTLAELENTYDKDSAVYEKLQFDLSEFYTSVLNYKKKKEEGQKPAISTVINLYKFTDAELISITEISSTDLSSYLDYVNAKLRIQYESGLKEEQLKQASVTLLNDPNLYLFPRILRETFTQKLVPFLIPNFKMNIAESEKKKKEALTNLEPIYKKITKGEAVIRKYDEITDEHINKLENLGLTNQTFSLVDFLKYVPSVLLFTLIFHFYCNRYLSDKLETIRKYALMLTGILLTVVSSYFIQGTSFYFVPTISLLIVFGMFWNRSFVLMTSIYLALLMNYEDLNLLIMTIIIGAMLATFKDTIKNFTEAIRSGLLIGLLLALTQFILIFTFEQRFGYDEVPYLILSGVFAGVIASGLIPILENVFGIATIYKLTELNKYDHPVLEELYKKAKGTFEHSRNVAHLVTVASNKIGTNTLLLKVAALYHDLGKIDNAEFFIENSSPEGNIHNIISPSESAKIILDHPRKSVEICKRHNIPNEVIALIETHHGDSILRHFYQKELEINPNAQIEDFKYPTPTPKTKEQGILLLADACEAYSRSLNFQNELELEGMVRSFVYKKIQQGELRDCALTTKEIEICIEEFSDAIFVTQHKRVPYRTEKVDG
jgi:putative nucleotidyltransferase with HDIG domain